VPYQDLVGGGERGGRLDYPLAWLYIRGKGKRRRKLSTNGNYGRKGKKKDSGGSKGEGGGGGKKEKSVFCIPRERKGEIFTLPTVRKEEEKKNKSAGSVGFSEGGG